jgi:murein DD-endopeptidase MepM/ murein hydrolase activator NlpD
MFLVLVLGALLTATHAIAIQSATLSAVPSSEFVGSIEHQEALLKQIDSKIVAFKQQLRDRTLGLHKLQQVPAQGPLYVWQQGDATANQKRDGAVRLVSLGLKEGLKELDGLENRRLEAQAELEWLKIQQEEIQTPSSAELAMEARPFRCRVLPMATDQKPELLQGFGAQKDSDTGLEWNSMGWWLSAIASEVRACESGRVVFLGDISGRGRVVMLDHGAGHLTVYANLDAASTRGLQRGLRVEAGSPLGRSLDRLYFEFRSRGVAADPREALRPDLLEQIIL